MRHLLFLLLTLALLAPALSRAQDAPPACRYDDVAAYRTAYDDWGLTLLDPIYKLSESYVPPDLVSVARAGLDGDQRVRALLLDDLAAMSRDAAAAGAPIAVQSAYRSYGYQVNTFNYWVSVDGLESALKSSARAGHSEHQLGTALDVRSADGPAPWELADWAETPAGAWMAANAWRYGFAMSYPEGREAATCYAYEPWHYRYLGREAAAELYESGLTLREWLWRRQ